MDGHFVPNLTFGAPLIRALRRLTDRPLDVHLMVQRPEQYIAEYADAGANVLHLPPRGHRARAAPARRRPRARHAGGARAQSGHAARAGGGSRARPRSGAGDVGQPRLRRPVLPAGRHRQDPPHPRRCSTAIGRPPRSRWTAASRPRPSPKPGARGRTPLSPAPRCSAGTDPAGRCATCCAAAPCASEGPSCRSNGSSWDSSSPASPPAPPS